MNNLKDTLIIFVIVGALCTGFYYYGKSHKEIINVKDTDTITITKTDTIKIKVSKLVTVTDTIIISKPEQATYDIVRFDTLITKDSSSVNLNIEYNEYNNKLMLQALFNIRSKQIIIKEYIESTQQKKWLYGDINMVKQKNRYGIGLGGGIILKNNYHIGMTINSLGLIGLSVGGEY